MMMTIMVLMMMVMTIMTVTTMTSYKGSNKSMMMTVTINSKHNEHDK